MALDRDSRGIIEIDSELNKIQDADLLLERILLEARRVVNAEAGSIYVKEGDSLAIKYSQNALKEGELPPGSKLIYSVFSIPIDEKTISGYVAKTGEPVNIPDVYRIPAGSPFGYNPYYDETSHYRTVSNLTVPLKTSSGGLLGVIQVLNAKNEKGESVPFTKEDEVLVSHFAANATEALQRAYMTRAMILRMIRMAELRDPKETGAHVARVSGYAAEIYERYAFNHGIPQKTREKAKDNLKLAAMLHDVGKVAISDLILKKPGRFTPDEYSIMQAHTYYGARLFDDPQSDLDRISAEVAFTHHENWDGTGYPGKVNPWTGLPCEADSDGRARRLQGEEIPLTGRIVAIADVFDALVSKRVYKEPWPPEQVYEEIKRLSGTKFDPEVVDAFFQVKPLIEQIRQRHPDTEDTASACP
jgi:response regulator RpfG family c-di-GMP phosphodiesterase